MLEIITAEEVGEILNEVAGKHNATLITPTDDTKEYSFVNHTTENVETYLTEVANKGLLAKDIESMADKAKLIAEVL